MICVHKDSHHYPKPADAQDTLLVASCRLLHHQFCKVCSTVTGRVQSFIIQYISYELNINVLLSTSEPHFSLHLYRTRRSKITIIHLRRLLKPEHGQNNSIRSSNRTYVDYIANTQWKNIIVQRNSKIVLMVAPIV